ncbi:MAG: response regulator [Nannocystaceae bacterium]
MSTILIIDDNVELAEDLKEILESEGYTVSTAASGEAGIAVLATDAIDLVLTDMRMPGLCGAQLARELRRRWPGVPVIPMTAYASEGLIDELLRCGAIGLISKPVRIDELCRLVARYAGQSPCVLVVEDDPDMAANIIEILEDCGGAAPRWAPDKGTALRVAARRPIGAAVVDIRLPDGDGVALVSELSEDVEGGLPVVYITGYEADARPVAGALQGAAPSVLLRKPFAAHELLRALRRVQA